MDQPGIRIAVPREMRLDLHLTQMLKHAELVRLGSIVAAIEMVRDGKVDAYAAPRSPAHAQQQSARLPGSG
jgi:ABC-type amino acid transport substrate-binding protein